MSNTLRTRTAKLRDLPLLRRLADQGLVLDSELMFTRAADSSSSALLSSIVMPQRGLLTLIARVGEARVAGQIRLKQSEHLAQIVYVAPGLAPAANDTPWLHLLDAMSAEAGKRGAHILTAEVDESSPLFQTMRLAGFAVYARQEIWQRPPGLGPVPAETAPLQDETDGDAMDIQLLYSNIVPRLVQHIAVPSSESLGLVYRQGERILGYIAVTEGKFGIYLVPYLHPDILYPEVARILAGAVARCSRGETVPVYVCMRRYQDWLQDTLAMLGFERWADQAVMVRHIAAGVRQAAFTPLSQKLEAVPSPIRPPTSQVTESVVEVYQQE